MPSTGLVGMDDLSALHCHATNFLDRGAGRNGIIIRGVTASPQTDATVGVYVGETPLTGLGSASPGSGGNPDLKYVDMQRVEVLRGPSGHPVWRWVDRWHRPRYSQPARPARLFGGNQPGTPIQSTA